MNTCVSEKKQYWCMFCGYRAWYEVKGEEFKSCPRCGNGMFVWEGRCNANRTAYYRKRNRDGRQG